MGRQTDRAECIGPSGRANNKNNNNNNNNKNNNNKNNDNDDDDSPNREILIKFFGRLLNISASWAYVEKKQYIITI